MQVALNDYFKPLLYQQVTADTEFLSSHSINDYSLLLGIHHLSSDREKAGFQKRTNEYLCAVADSDKKRREVPFYQVP